MEGVGEAQFDLARLYMAGKGVPLDYVSAYIWYSLAVSAGDDRSARQLRDLKKLMTPHELREAQARLSDPEREAHDSRDAAAVGAMQPIDRR